LWSEPIIETLERTQWRRHSREFKQQVVEKMKTSDNIQQLAQELEVERKLLYTWKYHFEGRPEKTTPITWESQRQTRWKWIVSPLPCAE